MSEFLTRLFGDSPVRTLIKLLLLSVLVGLILSKWGWKPLEVPGRLWHLILDFVDWGFNSFGGVIDTFLVGAMIVVPIFIIRQIFKKGKK